MLSGWRPSSEVAGIHFPHRCSPSWLLFSCSVVSSSLRPHGLQHCQASLSFTISWSLLKLMSIESVMPSKHVILCFLLLLPAIFPSIRYPVSKGKEAAATRKEQRNRVQNQTLLARASTAASPTPK